MSKAQFTGICLITGDVLRLRIFYEQVLQIRGEGDETHVELAVEGAQFAIFSSLGMEGMAPNSMQGAGTGSFTLEFQVEDIDRETARLISLHVPMVKPPITYPWGRRSAWFRDPDGNILNLYSVVHSL
jgi:predicted enzyme related to lactoylglutathione lyase